MGVYNNIVFIDIETKSSIPITHGVRKYTSSSDYEVQLISWKRPGTEVLTCDLTESKLPDGITKLLKDRNRIKIAHNARFEQRCLEIAGIEVRGQWMDTMVMARYHGLPGKLEKITDFIELPVKKLGEGKELIKFFANPQKDGSFNKPSEHRDKWLKYIEYNQYDVLAEEALFNYLSCYGVDRIVEWDIWKLDKIITDRGLRIDIPLCKMALNISEKEKADNLKKAKILTGLDNPNSVDKLKKWLQKVLPEEIQEEIWPEKVSLTKEIVEKLLGMKNLSEEIKMVLRIRQETSTISTKKYEVFYETSLHGYSYDNTEFYGCHTGRWRGRKENIYNLPKTKLPPEIIPVYKDIIYQGINPEIVEPDIFKNLIRTVIIPVYGKKLCVADWSAIEARVLAYLAGETWLNKVFAGDGKVYEALASKMFGVGINTIDPIKRGYGKIAQLALGYGGGEGAMKSMGWEGSPELTKEIITSFRRVNKKIVNFWHETMRRAKEAVQHETSIDVFRINFSYDMTEDVLRVELPSGRIMCYRKPRVENNQLSYINSHGAKIRLWHGILVENIVQGFARDILVEALMKFENYDLKTIFHVYDEIVVEGEEYDLENMISVMEEPINWAKGLTLKATGYTSDFYRKD